MSTVLTDGDHPCKIVLIDDDPAFRAVFERMLRNMFPECGLHSFADAGSALLALEQGLSTVELVLLDYQLPDLEGEVVLAELRRMEQDLAVIVVTGQGDEQLAADLLRSGADDYLVKSALNPARLRAVVLNCLERRRLKSELRQAGDALARRTIELEKKNLSLEAAYKKLRVSRRELQQLSASLELQVAERTVDLEKANRGLLETYQLRTELFRNVTHELRTPLHAVLGYAELLLQGVYGPVSPKQEEVLDGMIGRAEDLADLIDQILSFSRLDARQVSVTPRIFELDGLLREVLDTGRILARATAGERDAVEVYGPDPNEPAPVLFCDRGKLKQILVNLVGNAVKFTDEGQVGLFWYRTAAGLRIEVTDSGSGIPVELLSSIFEPFRQADGSATRRYGGTGLGLAISKRLAELLGGSLEATNLEGGGCCFCLILPPFVVHEEVHSPSED